VLLKKVVPYYCLDSIWFQWDMKYKNYLAPSIHTTINQFDTMVSSVITTSLGDQSMKDSDQAWVVEHWIEVARVFCKRTSQEGYHSKICTIPQVSPKD
jgi:ral guanine nucleotide dissociation stimulator